MCVAVALLAVVVLASFADAEPVFLSGKNFDEIVINSGKNSLVKFMAPWCGHCKRLIPAWDELGSTYATSSSVVVGVVDCTADDSKDLCERYEVRGYPSLKYFVDGDKAGQDYKGGREVPDFDKFIKETLEVQCQVADPAGCTEKETGFITKMTSKPAEEVTKQLDRLKGMMSKSMAPDLKKWIAQRVNILTQLAA